MATKKEATAWTKRIVWDSDLTPGGVVDRTGHLYGYTIRLTAQPDSMWHGSMASVRGQVVTPDGREYSLPQRAETGGWRRAFSIGVEWAREPVQIP